MSLISVRCYQLIILTLAVYFLLPLRWRWIALLSASVCFYAFFGIDSLIFAFFIALFSFCMGLLIEKKEDKKRRHLILSIAVILLVSTLAFVKIAGRMEILRDFIIVPVGISYFSLSIIGYLLEVYWKRDAAEKNFAHYLTFVLFFPKIVQGPISRYKNLRRQLIAGNRFSYDRLCFGMQLMLWGIFKKIALADRLAILVSTVYSALGYYSSYGGVLLVAMFCSALQLYFDFSGYTDIALGISQMFGIELEQNFNHPFFSRSAAGFWQRWHMTLSGWFKDYLFLPVSRSQTVKQLSKTMGSCFGASARKKTMMIISTTVVWLATGLWHGAGVNYLLWGVYWGSIIIASQLLEPTFSRFCTALHIRTESPAWKLFQILRTFIIFMVGKMISAQRTLRNVVVILLGILTNTHLYDARFINVLGLNWLDLEIVLAGSLVVLLVSIMQEKGLHIRECISHWRPIPRWAFYSFALTAVLLVGLYGNGYDTSSFAYQFF